MFGLVLDKTAKGKNALAVLYPTEQKIVIVVRGTHAAFSPGIRATDPFPIIKKEDTAVRFIGQLNIDETGKLFLFEAKNEIR